MTGRETPHGIVTLYLSSFQRPDGMSQLRRDPIVARSLNHLCYASGLHPKTWRRRIVTPKLNRALRQGTPGGGSRSHQPRQPSLVGYAISGLEILRSALVSTAQHLHSSSQLHSNPYLSGEIRPRFNIGGGGRLELAFRTRF